MKAKEKPKRSQRKAKGLPEFNLSHTTSASLLEAQLIAYYLREPPGEKKAPGRNYAEQGHEIVHWKNSNENRTFFCDE